MLTELLGRASILAVETVVDGVVIKPNHVYVTPPNAVLALDGATIRLVAPSPGARPEMPIDAFFRSIDRKDGNYEHTPCCDSMLTCASTRLSGSEAPDIGRAS